VNRFLELVAEAQRRDWCLRPGCTTCGAGKFRRALRDDIGQLAEDLASLDLDALERTPDWEGALRLGLDSLGAVERMDRALTAWLPQIDAHVRLADLILFYYVRRGTLFGGMSRDVLEGWRGRCVEIACATSDASLVESLIYTLGDQLVNHPELADVIRVARERSPKVALAVQRVAGFPGV
jgi:hypothetical protein